MYRGVSLQINNNKLNIKLNDDYKKVINQDSKGLSKLIRLLLGLLIAMVAALLTMTVHAESLSGFIAFPVFKGALLSLIHI